MDEVTLVHVKGFPQGRRNNQCLEAISRFAEEAKTEVVVGGIQPQVPGKRAFYRRVVASHPTLRAAIVLLKWPWVARSSGVTYRPNEFLISLVELNQPFALLKYRQRVAT